MRCARGLRRDVATCLLASGLVIGGLSTARAADAATPADLRALAGFHAALQALEGGRRRHVAVLQIGDSHTAGDHFSERMRAHLQRRFGNAGRGFLPPGAPHAYYRPAQIRVTQTEGWQTRTSNKAKPDPELFGLSGQIARAAAPEDVITIELTHHARIAALGIGIVKEPGGGALEVLADDTVIGTLPTGSEDAALQSVRLGLPAGTRRIRLRPFGDAPVAVSDHTLVGADPGVTLSNLGFSGAQVGIMARWDWPRAAAQIADLDPALIILAFGTNEGHAPLSVITARYARAFETRIAAVKRAAPHASLVIVGPPDANRYFKYCRPRPKPLEPPGVAPTGIADETASSRTGDASATVAPETKPARPDPRQPGPDPADMAPCTPLSADERRDYDARARAEDRALCRWHTPASLPLVREIQRKIAARHGVLFFDWFALLQGECGADRWVRQGLMHKDHVHFKPAGYWRAADALYRRLMAGYRRTAQ